MASETFAEFVERFLTTISIPDRLPRSIEVLQPYSDTEVRRILHEMCLRYYASASTRTGVWGINPGRFGAGLTGLAFTDPWAVQHELGITTSLSGRREMSAEFVSMVIAAYGGPDSFYSDVYMSALSPLGFIREGVNINFYDDAALEKMMRPHIIGWMNDVFAHAVRRDVTILLGSGKLRTFMERSVKEAIGVSEVIYLDHPRYIMQYRRREIEQYIQLYVDTIRQAAASAG